MNLIDRLFRRNRGQDEASQGQRPGPGGHDQRYEHAGREHGGHGGHAGHAGHGHAGGGHGRHGGHHH